MPYFVYILKSEKDNRYYYGQTQDLNNRLSDHNSGKVKYTKHILPWRLFAYKQLESRSEAMKYEKMLKNLHSSFKVLSFISNHD